MVVLGVSITNINVPRLLIIVLHKYIKLILRVDICYVLIVQKGPVP